MKIMEHIKKTTFALHASELDFLGWPLNLYSEPHNRSRNSETGILIGLVWINIRVILYTDM